MNVAKLDEARDSSFDVRLDENFPIRRKRVERVVGIDTDPSFVKYCTYQTGRDVLQEILTYRYTTAPEVPMKGESCSARTPLVSSVLSLTVLNLTLFDNFGSEDLTDTVSGICELSGQFFTLENPTEPHTKCRFL